MHRFRFEHKITLAYILVGSLWILFSDQFLLSLFSDTQTLSRIQTFKGWFYVLVTAGMFFFILRGYIRKLRKSQHKAEESDRLKTAFLQNVSHEIRTPMNAICGFSELLKKDNLTPEKKKQYLDVLVSNSNQLLSIVDDILSLSNIETGQLSVSCNDLSINKMLDLIHSHYQQPAAAKGVRLVLDVENNNKTIIHTDEDKLKQIIWNLVGNAVKFTNKGEVIFGFRLSENNIDFFVKDTGIGIAPEMCDKVFKRFVQADSSIALRYGGTGLGLTISKSLIEMLGGKIELNSQLDVGTTVKFSIPIVHPTAPLEESQTVTPQKATEKNNVNTILVAEDEEFNFIYIEELLKGAGVVIIRAKNGQEAVDICSQSPSVNLVIMDIRMPIMNGFEATKIIKKMRPSLPIVAHTAYSTPSDERNARSAGFDEYLPKPLIKKRLMEMLERFKV